MNPYGHISEMETILDHHQALLDQLNPLLVTFSEHQAEYRRLAEYYTSEQFMKDYEVSNAPSFPKDIKCGVLSEDAVYNLLADNHQIAIRMITIALDILENE